MKCGEKTNFIGCGDWRWSSLEINEVWASSTYAGSISKRSTQFYTSSLFWECVSKKALVLILSVVRIKIPDGKKTALHVKENKFRRLHIYMSI